MEDISFFEWEYEHHPNRQIVENNCNDIVAHFSENENDRDMFFKDTRPTHKIIFKDVTPDGHEYFAGNYRGASYPQLYRRPVYIGGYAGHAPELIEDEMKEFSNKFSRLLNDFYKHIKENDNYTKPQKLLHFINFLSKIFTRFLIIHPFANGNGHMARLIVWTFLQRENLPLTFWSIDKRPIPPLDNCIKAFREGDTSWLIKYFLLGIITGEVVTKETLGGATLNF